MNFEVLELRYKNFLTLILQHILEDLSRRSSSLQNCIKFSLRVRKPQLILALT